MTSLGSHSSLIKTGFISLFGLTIVGLVVAKSAFATILIFILIGLASYSPTTAIISLGLSFLIFFINPYFGETSNSMVTLGRTILPFIVFLTGIWGLYKQQKIIATLKPFIFLFFIFLTTIIIGSYLLKVSIFKLLLLCTGGAGILACFQASKKEKTYWLRFFFSLYTIIMLSSIATLAIPAISYFRNGKGFQGISNQPQALGIFITPFVCYLLTFILTRKSFEKSNFHYFLFITGIILLFLTGSRTSFLTILITTFAVIISKDILKKLLSKLFSIKSILYSLLLSIILASQFSVIKEEITGFIFKRGQGTTLTESFEQSRGFLILLQIKNIQQNPYFGIGFQLASIPKEMKVVSDPILGLPIQAPIEKGNLFTSLVEENGIVGSVGFIIFFILLLRKVRKNLSPPITAMFLGAFMTNIGEATLFSFGGMGLFVWLIIGLAYYSYKKPEQVCVSSSP